MAEERGDGEPVGEPADHRPFGRRLDIPRPVPVAAEQTHRDVDDRSEYQQACRARLHLAQAAAAAGFVLYREGLGFVLHGTILPPAADHRM